MKTMRSMRYTLALALGVVLAGCNVMGGDASREALWQADGQAADLLRNAAAALDGQPEAFDDLARGRDALAASIGHAGPDAARSFDLAWKRARSEVDTVLAAKEALSRSYEAGQSFEAQLPPLVVRLDEAARKVAEGASDPRAAIQVYMLGRLPLLLERMRRSVAEMRAGGAGAVSSADRFGRDGQIFERSLAGLIDGSEELGIVAVASPEAKAMLAEIRTGFAQAQAEAAPLLEGLTAALEAREAQEQLTHSLQELRERLAQARVRR